MLSQPVISPGGLIMYFICEIGKNGKGGLTVAVLEDENEEILRDEPVIFAFAMMAFML